MERALAYRAASYLRLGRGRQALKDAERAAFLAPMDHKAWLWKGQAHLKLNQFEQAARAFRTGVTLEPGNGALDYGLEKVVEHERLHAERMAKKAGFGKSPRKQPSSKQKQTPAEKAAAAEQAAADAAARKDRGSAAAIAQSARAGLEGAGLRSAALDPDASDSKVRPTVYLRIPAE